MQLQFKYIRRTTFFYRQEQTSFTLTRIVLETSVCLIIKKLASIISTLTKIFDFIIFSCRWKTELVFS